VDTTELQERFGAAIRRRRLEARLGQEKLADQAGLHRSHVSLIERGQGLPTLAVIHKLATALGTQGPSKGDPLSAQEHQCHDHE
jgi:transcriptional regulator with XRE-family HTH domain